MDLNMPKDIDEKDEQTKTNNPGPYHFAWEKITRSIITKAS